MYLHKIYHHIAVWMDKWPHPCTVVLLFQCHCMMNLWVLFASDCLGQNPHCALANNQLVKLLLFRKVTEDWNYRDNVITLEI